jgi:hypothetical protein
VKHSVHVKRGVLVYLRGQVQGEVGSSIVPSGRSSLLKYLMKKDIENMSCCYHTHQSCA